MKKLLDWLIKPIIKYYGKTEKQKLISPTIITQSEEYKIMQEIEETFNNQRGFKIEEYNKQSNFYFSNGHIYVGDSKGNFILYSIDLTQKIEA